MKPLLIFFQDASSSRMWVKITNYFTEAKRFHVQLQCHPEERWELRVVAVGPRRGVHFLASTPRPNELREKTMQLCCTNHLPAPIKSTSNPMQQCFSMLIMNLLRNKRIKIQQEIQKDPQRPHINNFLMNSSQCSYCPLPNFFLGLCHGHSALVQHPAIRKIRCQIKASNWMFLKVLLKTAIEKRQKDFWKGAFSYRYGKFTWKTTRNSSPRRSRLHHICTEHSISYCCCLFALFHCFFLEWQGQIK